MRLLMTWKPTDKNPLLYSLLALGMGELEDTNQQINNLADMEKKEVRGLLHSHTLLNEEEKAQTHLSLNYQQVKAHWCCCMFDSLIF